MTVDAIEVVAVASGMGIREREEDRGTCPGIALTVAGWGIGLENVLRKMSMIMTAEEWGVAKGTTITGVMVEIKAGIIIKSQGLVRLKLLEKKHFVPLVKRFI